MEIDLNELELHEKQLAERRRSQQQQQEQQSTSQTDGSSDSSGSSTLAMATSTTTTTTTTTSQNVDEIDAYLDRLALDLQAKDHRTNDARGANTSNHSNHPNQHSLVNNENSSQLNDDCDKNGATAAPTNSNQASTKTTLPLLIYAFLSLLAYVNTIRCKIYTLTHTHTTRSHSCHTIFLTIFPFCFFVFVIFPHTLCDNPHPFCVSLAEYSMSVSDVIKGKFCAYQPNNNKKKRQPITNNNIRQ